MLANTPTTQTSGRASSPIWVLHEEPHHLIRRLVDGTDIFFVALLNKRRSPCIRSVQPID
jgi:hypothetical protein